MPRHKKRSAWFLYHWFHSFRCLIGKEGEAWQHHEMKQKIFYRENDCIQN